MRLGWAGLSLAGPGSVRPHLAGVVQVSQQAPGQVPALPRLHLALQLQQHPLCQGPGATAGGDMGTVTRAPAGTGATGTTGTGPLGLTWR